MDRENEPHDGDDSGSDSDTVSLLQFIRHESLSKQKRRSKHVIIETYACTLWKGFFDMKHKLYQISNLDVLHAVEVGITLVDNLFWILFNCSSNLQLTLFLTERGRLLYSEFLAMSRTHRLMQNVDTYPTIQDGFQFAIKKSIGSLTCSSGAEAGGGGNGTRCGAGGMSFERISQYRKVYRSVFESINRKYLLDAASTPWSADHINLTLHKLNHMLSVAVRRQKTAAAFAHAVCQCLHRDSRLQSLPAYLLALQLLTDKGGVVASSRPHSGGGEGGGEGDR